jgi:hypothetical protein
LQHGFQGKDEGEADWKVAFTHELKKVEKEGTKKGTKTRSNDGILIVEEAKRKESGRCTKIGRMFQNTCHP